MTPWNGVGCDVGARVSVMTTTGRTGPGNLPAELSSFVGRGRELRAVRRLLGEARLVTLTGVGGTGKTRLALQVATGLRRVFPGGVRFVDLTQMNAPGLLTVEVQDPDVMAYLVMGALGVREDGRGSATNQLTDHLAGRAVLLVLDNCEHLVEGATWPIGCSGGAAASAGHEPGSAGDRRGDHLVGGTAAFPAAPPTAAAGAVPPAALEASEAVPPVRRAARGRRSRPRADRAERRVPWRRAPPPPRRSSPLALELAAVRVPARGAVQGGGGRRSVSGSLTGGSRAALPARQQTLRAAVDWKLHATAGSGAGAAAPAGGLRRGG